MCQICECLGNRLSVNIKIGDLELQGIELLLLFFMVVVAFVIVS